MKIFLQWCDYLLMTVYNRILRRFTVPPKRSQYYILDWTRKWQMQFNIDKCVVLRCTRSLFPITLDYKSDNITLKVVKQYKYLGIILHENMQ